MYFLSLHMYYHIYYDRQHGEFFIGLKNVFLFFPFSFIDMIFFFFLLNDYNIMLEFLLSKKFIWKNGMGKIRCFVRRNNTSENCLPQWNAKSYCQEL